MMSIIPYEQRAQKLKEQLFNDSDISEANKTNLKRFLLTYDVKPARKCIFYERIRTYLRLFPNPAKIDRDELNLWLYDLKEKYAPATVATVVSVVCCYERWLNDGQLPKEFSDFRKSNKKHKRVLNPDDMITWEEGLLIARLDQSTQMPAAFLSQLDGGFRPSEFLSIEYRDVQITNGLCVCHVRDGKTGSRHVVLYRSTPYLLKWLEAHPTKQPNDPLWINETATLHEGRAISYKYAAFKKRIHNMAKKAKVTKPSDPYALRHSSCTLDKKDNIPADLAAERHGHSLKHYLDVYGRLDVSDTVARFRSHFGMDKATHSSTGYGAIYGNEKVSRIMPASAEEAEKAAQKIALEHQMAKLQEQLEGLTHSN